MRADFDRADLHDRVVGPKARDRLGREETIHEKLPDGFQRAEYLLEHGMIDQVVPRAELRATLGRILGLLRDPHSSGEVVPTAPAEADPRGA